jgi:hypothetical protein
MTMHSDSDIFDPFLLTISYDCENDNNLMFKVLMSYIWSLPHLFLYKP